MFRKFKEAYRVICFHVTLTLSVRCFSSCGAHGYFQAIFIDLSYFPSFLLSYQCNQMLTILMNTRNRLKVLHTQAFKASEPSETTRFFEFSCSAWCQKIRPSGCHIQMLPTERVAVGMPLWDNGEGFCYLELPLLYRLIRSAGSWKPGFSECFTLWVFV